MSHSTSILPFLCADACAQEGIKYLERFLQISPPITYTDTSALPGICQRGQCIRDAVKQTNYCSAHQPKPKARPPLWLGLDVVYMVGVEGEAYVKVGFASELSKRMIGMQVSSPKRLKVLAVFAGDVKTESLLHRELQAHHVRGEWFGYDEAKALALRLQEDEALRDKLGVRDVVCRFMDEGYHWDAKGLPMSAKKKTLINMGSRKR